MLEHDRKKQIIHYLEGVSSAKITELAKLLYSSESTVRRDLIALEQAGLVKRVHGGAVLAERQGAIMPYSLREPVNVQAKEIVAQKAAELVHDGDTIMLDGISSTTRRLCKYIKDRNNVTIITNNYKIHEFFKGTDVTVFCTGGNHSIHSDCFDGIFAEAFIRKFNADLHFFSTMGISRDGMVIGKSVAAYGITSAMMTQSSRNYLLIDSSKLNIQAPLILCHASDLTGIICDKPIPDFEKTSFPK